MNLKTVAALAAAIVATSTSTSYAGGSRQILWSQQQVCQEGADKPGRCQVLKERSFVFEERLLARRRKHPAPEGCELRFKKDASCSGK
ncbi:MAG: hypothetical protein IPP59_11085 [Betaproteobacteria bacterium]|nr:hypothetical protein [Candidatus Dechloromonas phosphorivorans]